jgi:hypothetical protein
MRSALIEPAIVVGLAILVVSAWLPTAPVVTGMAIVTLGATGATISRLVRHPAADFLLSGHLLVYSSLYLLFVGAQWHSMTVGTQAGRAFWPAIDLAASLWPMFIAFRLALSGILDSRQRGEDATRS